MAMPGTDETGEEFISGWTGSGGRCPDGGLDDIGPLDRTCPRPRAVVAIAGLLRGH